jgi:protein-S-isoprenylcysteine O-methyltransferase Ste14
MPGIVADRLVKHPVRAGNVVMKKVDGAARSGATSRICDMEASIPAHEPPGGTEHLNLMDSRQSVLRHSSATTEPKDWVTRDRLTRVVVVLWFLGVEAFLILQFLSAILTTTFNDALGLIHLFAQACLLLFVAMVVWLTIVRERPLVKAPGAQPRIAAFLGTNLILFGIFFMPPGADVGVLGLLTSASLILTGHFLAVVVIRHLGRAFSIMAEARELVTDGPFAIVRHPLYLVEQLATIGVFIQIISWPAAILFAGHFAIQLQRMRNEESVLRSAFPPDYDAYAARTARLIPGIW